MSENLAYDATIVMNTEENTCLTLLIVIFSFVKVGKIEDSINVIHAREKPLAAYLFTNDKKLMDVFVGSVSAGGLCINDTTLHVIVLPGL